ARSRSGRGAVQRLWRHDPAHHVEPRAARQGPSDAAQQPLSLRAGAQSLREGATMRFEKVFRGAVAALAVGAISMAALGAAGDRSETLGYAVYDGQAKASEVFKTMQANQGATGERIEAYAVVSKDLKGKVKVRDQRKRDAGAGAIIGGVIGLLGGPIGVAAGATAGSAVGYVTGDAGGISRHDVEYMKSSLIPNSSALYVVLNDKWVQDVERDLKQADAREVVANQITNASK